MVRRTLPWKDRAQGVRDRLMGYALDGKVVLITGASAGIGRACAAAFCEAGAKVVGTARSADRLGALADRLGGDRFLDVVGDVTRAEDRTRVIEQARARFGRIDVLVNNAGWAGFGPLVEMPFEQVERMVALNFVSAVAMMRAVAGEMIDRGAGQIVNVASVVGYQTIPRMTVYSATKAALVSVSTGLRMELAGTGVDVVLVAPSSTRTDFFDHAARTNVQAVRFARTQYTPERVARAVVRACRRRRREVVLSVEGRLITTIRRVSHRLADAIMLRVARRAMPRVRSVSDSAPVGDA